MIKGFTCGSFDMLHPGHILMLEECKKVCDYLIVGLQVDPTIDRKIKNKPIQTVQERWVVLSAIKYIDKIIIYKTEKELYKLLEKLNPDIRIVGADWKGREFTGCELPIKIYFNTRDHGWSSSEIRERIYNAEAKKK